MCIRDSGYGARLDPAKAGIGLNVLIDITLVSQSSEAMERFERAVADFPDILECHLLSGTADYRPVSYTHLDVYKRQG